MSAVESCEVCGFRWDSARAEEIPDRLSSAVDSFVQVLLDAGPLATLRPQPDRWSILEYAGHLRDVLISIRERIITAMILDHPTGMAMNRDQRISLGIYANDRPEDVAIELETLANLLGKTLGALSPEASERTLVYSAITPETVTISWAAAQALHEAEHHRNDIQDDLDLLGQVPT